MSTDRILRTFKTVKLKEMGMTSAAKARIEARREEGVRKLRARAASIEANERIRLERCSWDTAEMERQLYTGSRSHYYPRTAYMTAVVEKKTQKVVCTAVSSEFFEDIPAVFIDSRRYSTVYLRTNIRL
jgi:hypothetical protein